MQRNRLEVQPAVKIDSCYDVPFKSSVISLAEQYQRHSGGYVLQSRSDATRALVASRRSGRSRGCDSCAVCSLLGIGYGLLTIRARVHLIRPARERERAGSCERLGLSRVGRVGLDSLHSCNEQIRVWVWLYQKRCQADLMSNG